MWGGQLGFLVSKCLLSLGDILLPTPTTSNKREEAQSCHNTGAPENIPRMNPDQKATCCMIPFIENVPNRLIQRDKKLVFSRTQSKCGGRRQSEGIGLEEWGATVS